MTVRTFYREWASFPTLSISCTGIDVRPFFYPATAVRYIILSLRIFWLIMRPGWIDDPEKGCQEPGETFYCCHYVKAQPILVSSPAAWTLHAYIYIYMYIWKIRGDMAEVADLVDSERIPLLTNISSNILERMMYPRKICLALCVPSMAGSITIPLHRTRQRRTRKEW